METGGAAESLHSTPVHKRMGQQLPGKYSRDDILTTLFS